MKTDLLTRLVRAINQESTADLKRIAQLIVEEERQKGHARIAENLQALLNKPQRATGGSSATASDRRLGQLPVSRRTGMPLARMIPFESTASPHDFVREGRGTLSAN